jgi:hypothetical protein
VSERDEMADAVQEQVLRAFGMKLWDITATVRPPLRIRVWRAVSFARRRGRVIDWAPYEAAEAELRAADEAYLAALPGRMQEIADQLSEGLPDGMRFGWAPDER